MLSLSAGKRLLILRKRGTFKISYLHLSTTSFLLTKSSSWAIIQTNTINKISHSFIQRLEKDSRGQPRSHFCCYGLWACDIREFPLHFVTLRVKIGKVFPSSHCACGSVASSGYLPFLLHSRSTCSGENGDAYVGRKETRRFTSCRPPSRARNQRFRKEWSKSSFGGAIAKGKIS